MIETRIDDDPFHRSYNEFRECCCVAKLIIKNHGVQPAMGIAVYWFATWCHQRQDALADFWKHVLIVIRDIEVAR